jgi:hypothetical protein
MMEEAIHRLQSCVEYSDEPLMRLPMATYRVSSTGIETDRFGTRSFEQL